MTSDFWLEHDAELRRLVDEGLTTQAAAVRLGVTKNAVVSRARRLGLRWASGYGRPLPATARSA